MFTPHGIWGKIATVTFALVLIADVGRAQPRPTRLQLPDNNLSKWINVEHSAPEQWSFENPRDGWVFFRMRLKPDAVQPIEFSLRNEADRVISITLQLAEASSYEGMRFIPKGEYRVESSLQGLPQLEVRAIPELHYVRYPQEPRFPALGNFSWDWLKKNVLTSVNTVVGFPDKGIDPEITEWTQSGGKFIAYEGLPKNQDLTGQQAFETWLGNPGFQDPRLSGLIADEFSGRQHPLYPAWIEGMRLLGERFKGTGKAFYAYCGGPGMYSRPESRQLVQTVFDAGFYMAWERYHHEMPTRDEAYEFMESLLGKEMSNWQAVFPDCQKQMVLVLGLFATGPDLDVQPDVNYKVWMDMQMQYLATNRLYDGLFGVHWWYSGAASQELLRWQRALYRHYAIEGSRELLSEHYGWTYMLDHIQNPDFLNGYDGWIALPAGEDTMHAGYLERYAWAQNRYWHRGGEPDQPAGNSYLWTKRQLNRPNTVAQVIRNLEPGKVYTVQMITADYQDIINGRSEKKRHAVSMEVQGGEIIPSGCYRSEPASSSYSHPQLPFENGPAWFNHHRVMFRATGTTGQLTIRDWQSADEPGGPEGQELMMNYIQLQPYFEESEPGAID